MAKQGENFEIKYRHNVYTNMAKYNTHSYIVGLMPEGR